METTMQIIIGLILWGIIYWFFLRPKEIKKNQSMTDILKNDPIIKQLDEEIAEINKNSHERMKTHDPEWIEMWMHRYVKDEDKKKWID